MLLSSGPAVPCKRQVPALAPLPLAAPNLLVVAGKAGAGLAPPNHPSPWGNTAKISTLVPELCKHVPVHLSVETHDQVAE